MGSRSEMFDIQIAVRKRRLLLGLLLWVPLSALAQITPNNNFAAMIQNNAAMQSNLTQQMINGMNGRGATSSKPICLPPFELQRGPAGRIPPESQGDPRYLEYVRCRYGAVTPQTLAIAASQTPLPVSPADPGSASAAPPQSYSQTTPPGAGGAPPLPGFPPAQHLPLSATDFVPPQPGHPVVEQQLANIPMSPTDRAVLNNVVNRTFNDVAAEYRSNNLAVSMALAYSTAMATLNGLQPDLQQTRQLAYNVNDSLAQGFQFAQMSDIQKQNASDFWIFETAMIRVLRDAAQAGDPQAAQQAVGLSQLVLQKLTNP